MFSDGRESGDGRMKTVYTFYRDDYPELKLAQIVVTETMEEKKGEIIILQKELIPLELEIVYMNNNNINGIEALLESRAVQPNRMFLDEYCEEKGLCPKDLDDRLKISQGRTYDDNFYIVREVIEHGF